MQDTWMYIVLAGFTLLFLSRYLPKPKASSQNLIKEMEEAMEQFAGQIEEDNKELLQAVSRLNHEQERQIDKLQVKIVQLESQNVLLSQEMKEASRKLTEIQQTRELTIQSEAQSHVPQPHSVTAYGVERMVQTNTEQPLATPSMKIKQRYPEVFAMYEQGKSIEYIAKKLGLNKGEVSLILQLQKQEEQQRA